MAPLNLYSRFGIQTTFDPANKFVTSPVIRSPLVFGVLRLTIAIYTMVALIVVLVTKAVKTHDAENFLSYFTFLTYIGICAYYFASGTQTIAYALGSRKSGAAVGYPLQQWPKFLQALHVTLQATITTLPILVTVVFWALLASPSTFSTSYSSWSNLSVHAFNTVFALTEILLSNSPPAPWFTTVPCILVLVGYLGVAYITHATQGIYTYGFLDPKKQGALLAAYIAGIGIFALIVFFLVRGIVVLRQRWAEKAGRVPVVLEVSEATREMEETRGNESWEHMGSRTSDEHQKV